MTNPSEIAAYTDAIPAAAPTPCRLHADQDALEARYPGHEHLTELLPDAPHVAEVLELDDHPEPVSSPTASRQRC